MLNTAISVLQMKISGVNLSTIQTMIITMQSQSSVIIKGNSDIEVDNDLISVFLTQEESNKLEDGYFNVNFRVVNFDGVDVSDDIKMIWAKRGSMSKTPGNGSGDADLSNYYTKDEVNVLIESIPKGKDGFSPSASVIKTEGTATVTIIDKNGTTQVELYDGENGLTPTIGTNGNWYIGMDDTGLPSRGERGQKGEDGGIISSSEIQNMIDNEFFENLNNVKIAQNEDGKWGYIPPGADTVIPFSNNMGDDGQIFVAELDFIFGTSQTEIIDAKNVLLKMSYIIAEGYEVVNG